jgi:hypothetical protein
MELKSDADGRFCSIGLPSMGIFTPAPSPIASANAKPTPNIALLQAATAKSNYRAALAAGGKMKTKLSFRNGSLYGAILIMF